MLIIHLTNNKYYYYYFDCILNIPFTRLFAFKALAMAGLLTPMYLAAAVKLSNDNVSFVSTLVTLTFTPINLILDSDILRRVSSDNLIPLRFSDILSLTSLGNILPNAAILKLFLVSSLTLRSSLKNLRVSSECL